MKTRTPQDLFLDQVRDLHSAETQLVDSLPVLAARASHTSLYEIIAGHSAQTVRQQNLLSTVLGRHGTGPVMTNARPWRG